MSFSCFLHIHGDSAQAPTLVRTAEAELAKVATSLGERGSVVLHTPAAVPGQDPLPVSQDARLLLCQVHVEADATAAESILRVALASAGAIGDGARTLLNHVMAAECIKPGAPDDKRAAPEAVSFFVQYNGPAQDPAAFHAYYRAHHVPIVLRMPGIRSVNYFTPTALTGPLPGRPVQYLQLVQAVFDSIEDFLAMRGSSERREGLRDFDNYPPFEGPVTHQVFHSRRLG
jgi:uncharacterized protein (TIGR02118 family)